MNRASPKVISPAPAFSSNEFETEFGVERKRGGTSNSVEVATVSANGDGEVPDPRVEQSNNELFIRYQGRAPASRKKHQRS